MGAGSGELPTSLGVHPVHKWSEWLDSRLSVWEWPGCAGAEDVLAGKDSGDAARWGAGGTTLITPPSTSLVHDQLE